MKPVTSTMVAQAAGVSQTTVSRVLNNSSLVDSHTRRKVIQIARELNYPLVPQSKSKTIGIIMTRESPITSFYAMTISALKEAAYQRNYRLEIISNNDLSMLNTRTISGAIAISNDATLNKRWSETTTLPLVRFESKSSHQDNIYSVYTDMHPLIVQVLNHLIEHGHRRIAVFLNAPSINYDNHIKHTGKYFIREMARAGIPDPERWIFFKTDESLDERLGRVLKQKPTAMIIFPGDLAIQVCGKLNEAGYKIPKDMSIISREYSGISEFWQPPLTTICPDYAKFSHCALELLDQLIAGQTGLKDIPIPGTFIIRKSVSNHQDFGQLEGQPDFGAEDQDELAEHQGPVNPADSPAAAKPGRGRHQQINQAK